MSNQPRVVKVLAALLFSMTVGAIVLMSLGENPPAAGPWSLSRSLQSNSPQFSVDSVAPQSPARWHRIEVCLSGTASGNIAQLAELSGFAKPEDLNCHFVICNGLGGNDGLVQATERWLRQWPVSAEQGWKGDSTTIRICVVADGKSVNPTDLQIHQARAVAKELSRKFLIREPVLYHQSLR